MKGYINSFQSLGAVDGPGLRFVVFMQGCPLRCVYCHNPETWEFGKGQYYTPQEVVDKALRYKSYFKENGGVTVSGGEPLSQWEFVAEFFQLLQKEGINTCLDTSGTGCINGAKQVLKNTDLVICDLKFSSEQEYKVNCNGSLNTVENFLELTNKMNVPLWIRHVVVPNLTDSENSALEIKRISSKFSNLQRLEPLPFKKMCVNKYKEMKIPFLLESTQECSTESMDKITNAFYNNL